MSRSQLVADLFARQDAVRKLTKTKRPYYLQSLTLFTACRRLPEPPEGNVPQNHSLEEVLKKVEEALRLGTLNTADKETDKITLKFQEAHVALLKYIDTYKVKMKNVLGKKELDNAAQDDREAAKLLRDLESGLKARMESMARMPKQRLSICFWPEDPFQWDVQRQQFTSSSHLVETLIKVAEATTLDMLMHRLFEYTALHPTLWKKFSLKQNPQLYLVFPSTKDTFSQAATRDTERIPCLDPWITVKRFKKHTLHLIVNRQDASRRNVKLKDGTEVELSPVCTNGWILADCSDRIVVRVKSPDSSLYLHKIGTAFELPPSEFETHNALSERLQIPGTTTPAAYYPPDFPSPHLGGSHHDRTTGSSPETAIARPAESQPPHLTGSDSISGSDDDTDANLDDCDRQSVLTITLDEDQRQSRTPTPPLVNHQRETSQLSPSEEPRAVESNLGTPNYLQNGTITENYVQILKGDSDEDSIAEEDPINYAWVQDDQFKKARSRDIQQNPEWHYNFRKRLQLRRRQLSSSSTSTSESRFDSDVYSLATTIEED
ncbi:hypothetical protein BDZ97DRAFT_1177022 [Flammula alnicola]|nr:hypothetical protein BDZ97DRAFT_1177022 [Flammula alnicola]